MHIGDTANGMGYKITKSKIHEGNFKHNKLHGMGRMIHLIRSPTGHTIEVYQGEFRNGVIEYGMHYDEANM